MNAREAKRRLTAVAAAVVFLSVLAIPPVYGGISHPEPPCVSSPVAAQPETVAVGIHECLGGAIDNSYTVEMPEEALRRLEAELRYASGLQQKFEVLREYGRFPENMSLKHIQRQYDADVQEQRIASSFFDTVSEDRTGNVLINLNYDVVCLGLPMLAFPLFIPGLGRMLLSASIPLPFTGIGAVFWLLAKIMLLAVMAPLVPMLTSFVGYTPLTVPFGLFWGLGIIDTNGTAGQLSTGGLLTGVVVGHFGVWISAFSFFTLFLGHAWAVVVHAGPA